MVLAAAVVAVEAAVVVAEVDGSAVPSPVLLPQLLLPVAVAVLHLLQAVEAAAVEVAAVLRRRCSRLPG